MNLFETRAFIFDMDGTLVDNMRFHTEAWGKMLAENGVRMNAHDFLVKDKLARLIPAIDRELRDAEARRSQHEAESRYQLLLERLPVIVYLSPVEHIHNTTYVSPQIETILGYTPEEWLSNPEFWKSRLHPADWDRVIKTVEESDRTGEPSIMEYRMLARDGHMVWFHDQTALIRDEGNSPYIGRH